MGSPTIFSGRYTKLLTNKGILNSDGSLNQYDGPINYVKYAEFEQNVTTGWSLGTTGTLTNAIPTGTPSFGSGASGNLSIATSNVSPIRDNFSLRYVSSAATTAGNMLATEALTIDAADQAKVLTFRFYYSVVSGATTANFSGTSSNSFGVAIWDVTNSAWIGVAGNFSMTQNSGVGIASGTFQTNSNTSQIRLVIYNANATSGAITLAFDDFFVGPQTAPIGPVVTDWVSYTPTGGWTTNTTYTGRWRRVGDSMEVQFGVALTGAPNAAALSINLPSGHSVDTSKLPTGSLMDVAGSGQGLKSGTGYILASYLATVTSVQISFIVNGASPAENNLSNTAPVSWANGDIINGSFRVPISGWSSNVQLSNDTDTRVVAAYILKNSLAPQASNTPYSFGASAVDTHGAWNGTTTYTIPVSGWYRISAQLQFNITASAGQYFNLAIAVNGTSGDYQTKRANGSAMVSDSFPLMPVVRYYTAGQQITIVNTGTNYSSVTASVDPSWISIERLSGPSVVAANESVSAICNTSAGQSIPFNVETIVIFGNKVFDSHNSMNLSTGIYTVPISGQYEVSGSVYFSTAITATATDVQFLAYRNGSAYLATNTPKSGNAATPLVTSGTIKIRCNAGDTLSVAIRQNNSASTAQTLLANAAFNWVAISRVGN